MKRRIEDALNVPIAVPTSLSRKGLSELVHQLLEAGKSGRATEEIKEIDEGETKIGEHSGVLFEFEHVASSKLLRSSLHHFCVRNNVSLEDEVALHYFIPDNKPSPNAVVHVSQEWLSAVDASLALFADSNPKLPAASSVIAGSYAGDLEVYTLDTKTGALTKTDVLPGKSPHAQGTSSGRRQAVKCVKQFRLASEGTDAGSRRYLLSGSRCGELHMDCLRPKRKKKEAKEVELFEMLRFSGHTSSVETVDYRLDKSGGSELTIASGSWDKNICLYNVSLAELVVPSTSADTKETTNGSKAAAKRKREGELKARAEQTAPGTVFSEHTSKVSALTFSDSTPTQLFSAGNDLSIKLWDIGNGADSDTGSVLSWNCKKVPTALDYSSTAHLLASSHVDGVVRLWDSRVVSNLVEADKQADTNSVQKLALKTVNRTWSSTVKWNHRGDSFSLVSGDYDGTLVLWDIRSTKVPSERLEKVHDSKIFGVDFDHLGRNIITVGADAAVRVHRR